jgi:hypothetical protein
MAKTPGKKKPGQWEPGKTVRKYSWKTCRSEQQQHYNSE